MTNLDQAHEGPRRIPDQSTASNQAKGLQASPHRRLGGRTLEPTAGSLHPGSTERTPVTDDTVASYFAGLEKGRMSERTLLAAFGYRSGTPEYDAAKARLTRIAIRFRAAGAIETTLERGVPIMEKGDPDALRQFLIPRSAGVASPNPVGITTPEARRVDRALAEHAARLKPPLQPKGPTTGAK